MSGGSSKLGRGGAARGGVSGGPNNRFSAPPLQPHRPALPSAGRLSLSGGPRNLHNPSPAPAAAAPPSVDETFSLVPGDGPPAFAMILRLTPDLVEEIRRVEAQGETAKIKFDANPKNPSGNLINVGGKEFRFTWSRECGDLCDIYEEKKSGEDGNGLLVESGCAWRKLNVQRILDESTTNHVKMLSEEAERKNKSRKAIVLEPGNPSMKSQIKQLAAVEATTWRMGFKKKEPPPKRRKVEPPNVSSSSFLKSTHKPGLSTNPKTTGKGIRAISPVISTPDPFQASASPSAVVNISKGNTFTDDFGPAGQMSKEETTSEREIPTKTSGKVNLGSQPTDLQSMLVSLLRDNPKGLSIKALEKAIGYAIPSSGKKILSRIADYKAPGRYLLKPGAELDGFKGSSPGSGSSFEDSHKLIFEEHYSGTPVPEPTLSKEEAPYGGLGQVGSAAEADLHMPENVDIEGNSPDIFGDKKDFDHLGGHAGNSGSDSGSSSSDSQSDSGSPSRSRSRSRSRSKSPMVSGSGNSSDSESYSSSDQEGSDVDVDIMTSDDDKRPKHNLQESQPTIPASTTDGGIVDIDGVDEKNDGHESDIVDIDTVEEGDYGHGATAADMDGVSTGQNILRERQNFIGSSFDLEEAAPEENFKQEKSDSSGRISRGKTVSRYDSNNLDVKTAHSKRLKKGSYPQPVIPRVDNGRYSLSPYDSLPDRHNEDLLHSPAGMVNTANQDANALFSMQKGNRAIHEKPILHSQQPSRRSYDQGISGSLANDVSGRPTKQVENSSHVRLLPHKYKSVRETQSDALNPAERGPRRKKDGSGKRFQTSDSPYDKSRETVGNNLKVVAETSNVQVGSSQKDIDGVGVEIPAHAGGRGVSTLPRELSSLEMGEVRPEEGSVKRPSERKGSMKQSEYKSSNIENRSTDLGKGKIPAKLSIESGKPSTPNLSRKRTVERREDEQAMPMPPGIQSQPRNPLEGNRGDDSAQISKKLNISKSARNGPLQLDAMRGKAKESKTQAADVHTNLSNGQKEAVSADNGVGLRQRESSSDENSCSYSKYEKDAPELKGRIKHFSQFEEYVQEYRDKYENYCSINKILENYRNKFQKMGRELEVAKGRGTERYNQALEQLRDSYRKYGAKHKRLKKIFIVLHQELKHLKQMMNDFAQSQSKD